MSKDIRDQEWENRVLCSDESCIGVIGPDGRCKECGLAYEGELPPGLAKDTENTDAAAPLNDTIAVASEEQEEAESIGDDPISDNEWAERTLCRDESCIGVIGPDGRCKECGLPYDE